MLWVEDTDAVYGFYYSNCECLSFLWNRNVITIYVLVLVFFFPQNVWWQRFSLAMNSLLCRQASCPEDYLLEYFTHLIEVLMLVPQRLVRIPLFVLKLQSMNRDFQTWLHSFPLCFPCKCLQAFMKTNTGDKDLWCIWGKIPLLRR